MKTKLIIIFTIFAHMAGAQSFQKKQIDINLGIGLLPMFMDEHYEAQQPFLHVVLDYGISDYMSLGIVAGSFTTEWQVDGIENCNSGNGNGNFAYAYQYTHKATHTIVAVRGAFHFSKVLSSEMLGGIDAEKLDLYCALMVGNNFESDEYTLVTTPYCDKEGGVPFLFKTYEGLRAGFHTGGRYRFTNNIGIFAEIGIGVTALNMGLNIKF